MSNTTSNKLTAADFCKLVDRVARYLSEERWPVTTDLQALVEQARNAVRPDDDERVSHELLLADGYAEVPVRVGKTDALQSYERPEKGVTVDYDGAKYWAVTYTGDFALVSMGHLRQLRGGLLRAGL